MHTTSKKILLTLTYYTLMIVMVAFVAFFVIGLLYDRVERWSQIAYIVLTGLLVALVIFDIICTYTKSNKFISGFILYGLTIATVILSFVTYSRVAVAGVLPVDLMDLVIFQIALSYAINILTIIIYCVGEHLINTDEKKSLLK